MDPTIVLSDDTRRTAGVLLLSVVAIEWGGWYLLKVVRGAVPVTDFQRSFERAGHAHAGVLVSLSLLALVLADGVAMSGVQAVLARNGIWLAAILLPLGFFAASAGKGRTEANKFVYLIYAGMVSLAAGVISLGLALVTS
jgi:hypothetical protein